MRIALVGLGVTGKMVAEFLLDSKELCMVVSRKNSDKAHKDVGTLLNGMPIGITVDTCDHLEAKLFEKKPDVLIDFSGTAFLKEHIATLAKCEVPVVTAVTGYEPAEVEKIKAVAQRGKIGVVMAPNITYGVNVLIKMVELAAELLGHYDFEIMEEHHRNKKDRPSGTAKKIAYKIMERVYQNSADADKTKREIPIHAIRSGGIVGKHKVLVCGEYDQIEISHRSFSRKVFAEGAYRAAQFIHGKTGFYEMDDVFNFERNKKTQLLEEPVSNHIYLPEVGTIVG